MSDPRSAARMDATRRRSIDTRDAVGVPSAPLSPSKRKYDLHPPGVLYLVITVFLAIGALNSQNNLLFLAFGFAIAGFLVSGVISGPTLMRLRARRVNPLPAHVGEQAEIRYIVESRSRLFSAMGLEIRELTDARGGVPGGGTMASAGLACLKGGARQTVALRLVPARRGRHGLVGFSITTTFPFGIFRKTLVFDQPQEWVVAPRRIGLRGMPWHRAGRDGATLSATTARRGVSTEFYALREYVPGDPTRQIAWLPSARVGHLVVREQAASAPPRIWIHVDEPGLDTPPHLVERGAALVAALAGDAVQAGFAVGLSGRGVGTFRPLAGPRQVRLIQTTMAALGHGAGPQATDDPHIGPDHRTLRVRVEYRASDRGRRSTEFMLSAAEMDRWFDPRGDLPDEFAPESDDAVPGGRLERLGRAVRRRLGGRGQSVGGAGGGVAGPARAVGSSA